MPSPNDTLPFTGKTALFELAFFAELGPMPPIAPFATAEPANMASATARMITGANFSSLVFNLEPLFRNACGVS
jgi:hypothetical protein